MRRHFQEQGAEVRYKINRRHPTDEQRNDGHSKDGKGVFTRHGLGQTNRQKSSCSDQGARQHGHGREFVSKGGGTHFVVALFHFANHHFNRNDGVVYQQT